eukprot:scaffold8106_cov107-Isochrysis_galbana.AAC.11
MDVCGCGRRAGHCDTLAALCLVGTTGTPTQTRGHNMRHGKRVSGDDLRKVACTCLLTVRMDNIGRCAMREHGGMHGGGHDSKRCVVARSMPHMRNHDGV